MSKSKKTARPRGTDGARVIRVVETMALAGCGTEEDPCRLLVQYWDVDGTLLAKRDEYLDSAILS